MRKLIFIILKIAEVVLTFSIVGFLAWLINYDVFVLWLENKSPMLFWIVYLCVFFYCLINLIRSGFFKQWFKSNWIFTDKIICFFKRDKKITMDLTETYNALALSKPKRRKVNRVIKKAKRKDISYKRLRNIGRYLPGFMYCIYHHKDTPENPDNKKYSYDEVVNMLKSYQEFINR